MAIRLNKLLIDNRLAGQRVLVRAGLDVPLKEEQGEWVVKDATRLIEVAPVINDLLMVGARVVVVGHLGRPKGRVVARLRSKAIARTLLELLPQAKRLETASHWHLPQLRRQIGQLHNGEVMVLENVRFHPGEEKNDHEFAEALASLADVYVNEAFSNSHRTHASMVAITKYLPSYAGPHLVNELEMLDKLRAKPKKPLTLVVGGIKLEDKMAMLIHLAPKLSAGLVGGVAANTMLQLQGIGVGKSVVDPNPPVAALQKILTMKKRIPGLGIEPLIHLPKDVVVANDPKSDPRLVDFTAGESLAKDEIIYDVGPKTIQSFSRVIKKSSTIIWNGPMGMIEEPHFRFGSVSLARLIAARSSGPAFGVVGGGDSLSVLDDTDFMDYIDYRSSGGGAMLHFLAGKSLPAVVPLLKK